VPADATGILESLAIESIPATDGALEVSGWLNVPVTGEHQLLVDGNSRMLLRIHEAAVIDADRRRSPEQTLTVAIDLEAGLHPLRLTALLSVDAPRTELRWHLPDASESVVIPAEAWFCQ
jgi:hypothetical protein